jgi:Cu+-exporting ATPase
MDIETAVKTRDHVCGASIESITAAERTDYKGKTYYFCGPDCKKKFDLKPEQFMCKSAATPKKGHCCG